MAIVWSDATVPSFTAPLLSWISSSASTSGAARFFTTYAASWSYLACGSAGARFSTLKVATASCSRLAFFVTSRCRLPLTRVGVAVGYIA